VNLALSCFGAAATTALWERGPGTNGGTDCAADGGRTVHNPNESKLTTHRRPRGRPRRNTPRTESPEGDGSTKQGNEKRPRAKTKRPAQDGPDRDPREPERMDMIFTESLPYTPPSKCFRFCFPYRACKIPYHTTIPPCHATPTCSPPGPGVEAGDCDTTEGGGRLGPGTGDVLRGFSPGAEPLDGLADPAVILGKRQRLPRGGHAGPGRKAGWVE